MFVSDYKPSQSNISTSPRDVGKASLCNHTTLGTPHRIDMATFLCPNFTEQVPKLTSQIVKAAAYYQSEFESSLVGQLAGITKALDTGLELRNILGSCDRSVFALQTYLLQKKLSYLDKILGSRSHISRRPYLISEQNIFSNCIYIGWDKYQRGEAYLKNWVSYTLIQSGIFKFWKELSLYIKVIGMKQGGDSEVFHARQELNSNFLTIFAVFGCCVGISGVCFSFELLWKKCTNF